MPTLTFSYDTGAVPLSRIVDGVAAFHNYQAMITPNPQEPGTQIPNPESKSQFASRMIKQHIIMMVRSSEGRTAELAVTNIGLT